MGQIALGLAGAAVGSMFGPMGGQIGWLLGSFAWNLLDPPKAYGPRLNDRKVSGADYGTCYTILFGTCRIAGIGEGQGSIVDGPNEFTEHEEVSSGKGGPEQHNFTYSLSFFNGICEGPIVGVWRRWANGRLVTEGGVPASDLWPFTLYTGDTTQMPDPTMELVYGAGEVSPMRGRAYESVEELSMLDYGNARPSVEYEAYTAAGVFPWRVSTFNIQGTPDYGMRYLGATYDGRVVTLAMNNRPSYGAVYYERYFDIQGNETDPTLYTDPAAFAGGPSFSNSLYCREELTSNFLYRGDIACASPFATSGANISYVGQTGVMVDGEYMFTVSGNTISSNVWLERWILGGSNTILPNSDAFVLVGNISGATADSWSGFVLGTSNEPGQVYLAKAGGDGSHTLTEWDVNLTTSRTWDIHPAFLVSPIINGEPFVVYRQRSGKLILACDRGLVGFKEIYCFELKDDLSVVPVAGVDYEGGPVTLLGNGPYMLVGDGVLSLEPPPASVILGDIVEALLIRAGLTSAEIDVTDLTQEVRGFVVASQMTVRNAIDVLRKGFFFDVTEYDGKVVCRNRGHDATETIPDGDLCAHTPGSAPPDPLEVVRVSDELPRTVNVNHYNYEAEYQQGSQYWRRTVTLSQSDVTLDLPIVFTPNEAFRVAQWHMHFAWLERDRFTFHVTDEWCRLRPTDVVVVRGVNIRLTSVTEMPTGVIRCEGVLAFAGAFTGGTITDPIDGETPGAGGGGQPPQEPPAPRTDTGLVLIDGPWLSESDSATAVRAAMYKDGTGAWPGATLYKSTDGGVNYSSVGATGASAVIGNVALALGDFAGGNIFDELNTLTVVMVSGTLSSVSTEAVQNGENLFALGSPSTGWEYLQARTATLTGTDTYALTGLLRGRYGTEHMMGEHGAGEILVLVSSTVLVPGSMAEVGLARKYKAVTAGTAIADADVVDFTNTGVALKAWSPVLAGGGRDASGNLTLNWTPRRRGSGGWPNGVDLPATDPANWQIEIATDATFTTFVRGIGTTVTTYVYTAADQTTDFGSPQSTVYWRVAQFSALGLGYFEESAT